MVGMFYAFCRSCLMNPTSAGMLVDGPMGKYLFFVKLSARTVSNISPVSDSDLTGRKEILLKEGDSEESDLLTEGRRDVSSNSAGFTRARALPAYAKLGESDKLISKVMMSVTSKKNLKKGDQVLLEGSRLINDAIKFGMVPKIVFFSRVQDAVKIDWPPVNFDMYKVAYKTIKMWSNVTTSPGVIGIFSKPDIKLVEDYKNTLPLIIVCDNIRDPGNLGSILRVAAGAGCQSVLLTKGCVEVWDPKVIRSGAGAHFVVPIHTDCCWEELQTTHLDDESTVVLADNCSSSLSYEKEFDSDKNDIQMEQYHSVDYSGAWSMDSKIVLVLGGETAGLSKEACELARSRGGVRLNIPLHNGMESLNVSTALGVIAFEIRHQYDEWCRRHKQKSTSETLLT